MTEDWPVGRRIVFGATASIGMGFLAGGIEATSLAAREALPLGFLSFSLLGLADILLMGGFALLIGLVFTPAHLLLSRARVSTAIALQLTWVGFWLCGWFLWQAAIALYTPERAIGAMAMAAMPIGFTGVIFFNARYAARRMEIGRPLGLPWLPSAFGSALALVLLSAGLYAVRDTGGPHALSDDKNVLLITVDSWSLPAEVPAPGMSPFRTAITPAPASRPAIASILTGLHPLRNTVLFDDDVLPWQYQTLAELLTKEGYATGAFVSSPVVGADSGLEQGFRVFDDDSGTWIPGLRRINLMKWVLPRSPRPDADTLQAYTSWLSTKRNYPFFAWVHLQKPGQLSELVASVDDLSDETLILVAGARGAEAPGLTDASVRIPMFLRFPSKNAEVDAQVRLMDLAATAITFLGIEGPETEGLDLAGYVEGSRKANIACTLIGRDSRGEILLGLRNSGIKFIEHPGSDQIELYHIESDPTESHDIHAEQADTVTQAQRVLGVDSIRLEKLLAKRGEAK